MVMPTGRIEQPPQHVVRQVEQFVPIELEGAVVVEDQQLLDEVYPAHLADVAQTQFSRMGNDHVNLQGLRGTTGWKSLSSSPPYIFRANCVRAAEFAAFDRLAAGGGPPVRPIERLEQEP